MARVVYIVARDRPLLCGYLMATMGDSLDGHRVEFKVDARRGERRLQSEPWDPERRRLDRRREPSLDGALRARGYAAVVQSTSNPSRDPESTAGPRIGWQPRSTWRKPRARARRRERAARWVLGAFLLAAIGVLIVVARSIPWPAGQSGSVVRSPALQPAPRIEDAPPPPPIAKAETALPPGRPTPPASPGPVRVVSTRSSGLVLSVNPTARTLVLQDMGANAESRRLRVELAPDARIVLSERDDQAEDPSHPFKDTVVNLSDVRSGDFVVVEMRGPEGKALARSVVVTLRGRAATP